MPDVKPFSDDFSEDLGLNLAYTGKLPFTCPECGTAVYTFGGGGDLTGIGCVACGHYVGLS